jgi:hypothetical protein
MVAEVVAVVVLVVREGVTTAKAQEEKSNIPKQRIS